jgi:hypothetical protein
MVAQVACVLASDHRTQQSITPSPQPKNTLLPCASHQQTKPPALALCRPFAPFGNDGTPGTQCTPDRVTI